MVESDVNPYPVLLLVNFWEIRPVQMGARLDELKKKGVFQLISFVPWQVAESDITHTLVRFLQCVSDRKMKVFLILSPEVGTHYPNSGLPKDVMVRKDNLAQDFRMGKIPVHLPPNSFQLPSYFAPEFSKRYYSFLGRLDGLFHDLEKNHPQVLKSLTAVLTGSFWKYYRSPRFSSHSAFGGSGGDYSSHAALAYRQRIESHYCQKEFVDPTPSAANRWKTRSLEEVNRRWFYQQSEDVFRHRTHSMIQRRSTTLKVAEMELFTPEADPGVAYSNFLQMVSGGHADFSRLSSLIDQLCVRGSFTAGGPTAPFVHWTSMGGFRMLAEAEKQFLFLKALLLVGGQKGGVLLDDAEWLAFSPQFRNRVDILARSLEEGDFTLKNRVFYLTPHLWTQAGDLLEEVIQSVGCGVRVVSTLDLVLRETFTRLLIVDPTYILTREAVQKITGWAKAGRVVVLPRSPLYTESGRIELEQVLVHTKRIEIDLGVPYRLHSLGDGKLIIYDAQDSLLNMSGSGDRGDKSQGEPLSSLQTFVTAILSISEVESYCRLGDKSLSVIPLERKNGGVAIFVFNASQRTVTADIMFASDVLISDLGALLSGGELDPESGVDGGRSNRYSLEVPPFGILPLHVEGINFVELKERQIAALSSEQTRENAGAAALAELPGFSLTEGFGELWN